MDNGSQRIATARVRKASMVVAYVYAHTRFGEVTRQDVVDAILSEAAAVIGDRQFDRKFWDVLAEAAGIRTPSDNTIELVITMVAAVETAIARGHG